MNIEDMLRGGDLEGALAGAKEQVRKQPAAAEPRILIFQLLAITGQWERALTQLNVVGDLDPASLAMVQTYRETLRCSALRDQVFAGKSSPLLFGEPKSWMAMMVEALRLSTLGEHEQAQDLRGRAFEEAAPSKGEIDGKNFEWIADADSRIGPFLEVILAGRYNWVPFECLNEIKVQEPEDLRDLVWTPVELTFVNEGSTVAFVPTIYPGRAGESDSKVQLARCTNWESFPAETYHGHGQRILTTDVGDHSLLDVRSIVFERADG